MAKLYQNLANAVRRAYRVIADNLVFFSQRTGLHGVKFIGRRTMALWERLFFLTSFIIITAYVAILISNIWAKWGRTPVIVAMSPHPIQIQKFPFPTVTICNVNQLRLSLARNYSKNSTGYSVLKTMCSEPIDDADPKVLALVKNRTFFQKTVLEEAQSCKRLLVACTYGKTDLDCEEIFRTILTDEGICCTFNALHPSFVYRHHVPFSGLIERDGTTGVNWDLEDGYPKKLPMSFYPRTGTGTGMSMGLTITVNAEVHDYTCTTTNGAGFKVILTNSVDRPTLRENGLFVEVGREVSFRITAERTESTLNIRSFSIKDRQCVFQSERKLAFFKTYTKANCELECLTNMSTKLCGCTDFYVPESWSSGTTCTVSDDVCQEPILNWADVSPMQQKCKDFCIKECFDLNFRPKKYSIPLSTGDYLIRDKFLQQFNASYRMKNIAMIHFYYESSDFTQFMRTRYIGPTEFTSNAGGLIGFLGFSFITVAEFSYFILLKSFWSLCSWIWGKIRGKPLQGSVQKTPLKEVTRNGGKSSAYPKSGGISGANGRFKTKKRISYRP